MSRTTRRHIAGGDPAALASNIHLTTTSITEILNTQATKTTVAFWFVALIAVNMLALLGHLLI